MFQELNERLADLKMKQQQKQNWEYREKNLTEELQRKRQERDRWADQLRKEQNDVDKLTGMSLGALFFTLIGKKEEKLSEEESEVLQAKLKYEEASDTVAELEQELAELKQQLNQVRFIDSEIHAVMEEKKRLIYDHYPELAAELQEITNSEAETQMKVKELQEAANAGRTVISALGHAEEKLESAKNWGTYDMFGGGTISTAIKHQRIDEARSSIHAAQSHLRRFQTELQDVQRTASLHIDIGEFLTFADYFFDGFITDWVVQGRISDSLSQVADKRRQIQGIVSELESELRAAEGQLTLLRNKRNAWIENT